MQKGEISFIFIILHLFFTRAFSEYLHSIKLKVNKRGSVKIINNPSLKPSKIYINNEYIDSNKDTITVGNIDDEIKLEWSVKLTDCSSMFATLNAIIEIDLTEFDSSDVTDTNMMFYQCTSLRSINFCNFNTIKVTNMSEMFANCTSLTSLDVSGFKTSKVQYMIGMFYACYSLRELDLSKFDTSSVISFGKIFMDCFNLKFINLEGIQTIRATEFSSMFYNCYSLKSLDLSSFKTSSVFSARYMFYNCTSLISLDISNFYTTDMYVMNNMFSECKNLGYINFKNFKKPGGGIFTSGDWILDNILDNTPQNMVMCFTESEENEFSQIFSSKKCKLIDCSQNWKSIQKKINAETGNCMDSCSGEFKYYYQYKCYKQCPLGTSVKENSFNCEDNDVEKPSWLKNEQIVSTCKIVEFNHPNLEQETEIKEKVPTEIVELKEKTIDIYNDIDKLETTNLNREEINEYSNIKGTSINTEYINICNITSFFKNECELDNLSLEQKQNFVSDIISKIKDGSLDSLMMSIVNNNEIIKIENENEVYSISTTENQNLNETRTIIDLDDCEKELKAVYNLTEDEKIIIFKIEKNFPGYKVPIMGYELFSKNGKIHLDMDYCQIKNIKTNTYIAVNIDEKEIFKFEPKNKYYNDRCIPYSTEDGLDITLYDRKKEFNDNNMSLCEINCEYKGYDINNKAAKCECGIKSIKNVFENKDHLLNEFINIKKIMNLDIIKCYKLLFNLKGLKGNIGNYIIFALFLLSIITTIFFWCKGYDTFIKHIISLIKKKQPKNIEIKTKNAKLKKEKNKKSKSRISLKSFRNDNIYSENILTINYTKNIYNNDKNYKKTKKKKKIKFYLNDYEMNSLNYDKALEYDKRTYFGYYISLIRTKQIIMFTFFVKSDYNSRQIKIILSMLSFAFFYAINALFFTDSTMHQIYIDHGVYDYFYQLPQIFYSAIISTIVDSIISYLSLTEESISELKQKKLSIKLIEMKKLIKCIRIKFIILFSLNFIFLGCIWYYLTIFCAIYKNTQIFLIKDTLISFATSLAYPFLYNLIPGIFRIPALKAKKKDRNFLYKISQFLQVF